ncbi:hypothetical protein AY599_20640 [Leptolyngbya valderiana BDU 20041]|nr:hypothetical protein AY599_20640 [Leptolyngbya valderiana BDU 20041]
MCDDVDRSHVTIRSEGFCDLFDTVPIALKNDDIGVGDNAPHEIFVTIDTGIDENDLARTLAVIHGRCGSLKMLGSSDR